MPVGFLATLGCSMYGNRTRHSSVKGRRLNRLTNTPLVNLVLFIFKELFHFPKPLSSVKGRRLNR